MCATMDYMCLLAVWLQAMAGAAPGGAGRAPTQPGGPNVWSPFRVVVVIWPIAAGKFDPVAPLDQALRMTET